jgi:hypothetical protein
LLQGLGRGEEESIRLAIERRADWLLIDDYDARQAALASFREEYEGAGRGLRKKDALSGSRTAAPKESRWPRAPRKRLGKKGDAPEARMSVPEERRGLGTPRKRRAQKSRRSGSSKSVGEAKWASGQQKKVRDETKAAGKDRNRFSSFGRLQDGSTEAVFARREDPIILWYPSKVPLDIHTPSDPG